MKQDTRSEKARKAHEEFEDFYWGVGASNYRNPSIPDPVLNRAASSSRSWLDFWKGLWKLRRAG